MPTTLLRLIALTALLSLTACAPTYNPALAYPPTVVQAGFLGNASLAPGQPVPLGRTNPYYRATPLFP